MLRDIGLIRKKYGINQGWELKDGKIVKLFEFSSFMKSIEFVNKIAKVAERLDHHPIITINWKTVKLKSRLSFYSLAVIIPFQAE